MDVESILTWFKKDGKDTGAWQACTSEQTRIGGLLTISSNATAGTEVQLSIPSSVAFEIFAG
jgi:hypothetical protein